MQCTCGCPIGLSQHKAKCALVKAALKHLMGPVSRNVRGLGQARKDKDLYETDVRCATAVCTRLDRLLPSPVENVPGGFDFGDGVAQQQRPRKIIEPSAGTGNFVRAIRATWPNSIILAVDLFQANALKLHAAGATSYVIGKWEEQREVMNADLIIGNPPFSLAEAHVAHSLSVMHDGAHLAFLLPMSFITTQGRCKRLYTPNDHVGVHGCGELLYILPLAERPSFDGYRGKTDMVEYGVYIWQKGWTGICEVLSPLWWRHPEAT